MDFVRLLTDYEDSSDINAGVRVNLDVVISYEAENLSIKITNSDVNHVLAFSTKENLLKVLNYLDAKFNTNLYPGEETNIGEDTEGFIRLMSDASDPYDIMKGIRVALFSIGSYREAGNFFIKFTTANQGQFCVSYSNQENLTKILRYLDTKLSVNMLPFENV